MGTERVGLGLGRRAASRLNSRRGLHPPQATKIRGMGLASICWRARDSCQRQTRGRLFHPHFALPGFAEHPSLWPKRLFLRPPPTYIQAAVPANPSSGYGRINADGKL